ncbi:hypothetical protein TNCV_2259501 [Trichonephila clavipes]|nr:hypothetical protein TNCV_2259501 [Trichonephila clavipes]
MTSFVQTWFQYSPERSRFTDFGSPPLPMSVLWIAKGDIFDNCSEVKLVKIKRRRRIPFDYQKTSLAGLAQIQQPVVASGEPPAHCNAGPHPGTTWSYKTGVVIHSADRAARTCCNLGYVSNNRKMSVTCLGHASNNNKELLTVKYEASHAKTLSEKVP